MDLGLSQVTVRSVARDRASADRLFPQVLGVKLVWVAIGLALLAVARADAAIGPGRHPAVLRAGNLLGRPLIPADRARAAAGASAIRSRGAGRRLRSRAAARRRRRGALGRLRAVRPGGGVRRRRAWSCSARCSFCCERSSRASRRPSTAATWRDIQSAALPLGFFMIALNTYTYIDTVILGLMRTDAEVGWYAAAYRVYEGLTYAPSILAAVLTPRLSYLFTHDRAGHRIAPDARAPGVAGAGRGARRRSPRWRPRRSFPCCSAAATQPPRRRCRFCRRRAVRVRDVDSSRRGDLDEPRPAPPADHRHRARGERGPQHRVDPAIRHQRRRLGHRAGRRPDRACCCSCRSSAGCDVHDPIGIRSAACTGCSAPGLLVSYAYFYQGGGWNQNSRFALVRAMTERDTLQIDAYREATGDRAVWNGHFYSDKAPGDVAPVVCSGRPGASPEQRGRHRSRLGRRHHAHVVRGHGRRVGAVHRRRGALRALALARMGLLAGSGALRRDSVRRRHARRGATRRSSWATRSRAGCLMIAFTAAVALRDAPPARALTLAWTIGLSAAGPSCPSFRPPSPSCSSAA